MQLSYAFFWHVSLQWYSCAVFVAGYFGATSIAIQSLAIQQQVLIMLPNTNSICDVLKVGHRPIEPLRNENRVHRVHMCMNIEPTNPSQC